MIPKVKEFLKEDGKIIALIKPQFEVGKGEVGKGGIVREDFKRQRVINEIKSLCQTLGFEVKGVIPSPILGAKGNQEYLLYAEISE
ncbi:MAG: 16S/23S rRNA (cytidine-2'-O)-methyltransferase TlyA [Candidatus Methanoperedenaceae archaeon GB50]|nr:MAG: 16S/23S rRNA (cytidine-2'-O)-methyltransferase TlyA [Candidatus Methanoperedenaceae archaeon GB50]